MVKDQYTLVTAATRSDIVSAVNDRIKDGYSPIGGIATYTNPDGGAMFAQSLVLVEPAKAEPIRVPEERSMADMFNELRNIFDKVSPPRR